MKYSGDLCWFYQVWVLHDWQMYPPLEQGDERWERGRGVQPQQLACAGLPIPAKLQPAAHTGVLPVCPAHPLHCPLHCLPVGWPKPQTHYYSKNTAENERKHRANWASCLGSGCSVRRKRDWNSFPSAIFITRISCNTSSVATSFKISAWAFAPERHSSPNHLTLSSPLIHHPPVHTVL